MLIKHVAWYTYQPIRQLQSSIVKSVICRFTCYTVENKTKILIELEALLAETREAKHYEMTEHVSYESVIVKN
jgi:hypothetical protein